MNFFYILYAQSNWPLSKYLGQFFYFILIVAFVGLLAYYSTKLLASSRTIRKRSSKRNLEVIENLTVGAQAMTQIVRVGEQYFFIGVTKENVTLLAELDKSQLNITDIEKLDVENSFDKVLKRFIKRNDTDAAGKADEAQDNE